MSAFINFKAASSPTPLGLSVLSRKLNPLQGVVYLLMYSLCYKGSSYKRMRPISYIYVMHLVNSMYQIEVSKRQVRRCVDKIVSLGLLERKTAVYARQYGNAILPTKTSYYRISTPSPST